MDTDTDITFSQIWLLVLIRFQLSNMYQLLKINLSTIQWNLRKSYSGHRIQTNTIIHRRNHWHPFVGNDPKLHTPHHSRCFTETYWHPQQYAPYIASETINTWQEWTFAKLEEELNWTFLQKEASIFLRSNSIAPTPQRLPLADKTSSLERSSASHKLQRWRRGVTIVT